MSLPTFDELFFGGHERDLLADGLRVVDSAGVAHGMAVLPPGVYSDLDICADQVETAHANARLWATAPHLLALCRLLALTVARFHHMEAMSAAKVDEQMARFLKVPESSYTPRQVQAADRVFTYLLGRAWAVHRIVDRLPDTQPVKGGGA